MGLCIEFSNIPRPSHDFLVRLRKSHCAREPDPCQILQQGKKKHRFLIQKNQNLSYLFTTLSYRVFWGENFHTNAPSLAEAQREPPGQPRGSAQVDPQQSKGFLLRVTVPVSPV